MLILTYSSLIFMMITNILMLISILLAKKTNFYREKNSPFECGFNPQSNKRLSFSLHFFLIAIIFLIFDVEIVLILPMILSFIFCNFTQWMVTSCFFFMILLLGLYHEWNSKILSWTN